MITGRFSPITFLELLLKNDIEGFQIYDLSSTHKSKKVCRNTRCAFFFFVDYKNRLIFLSLRYFEDFFDLCVRSI